MPPKRSSTEVVVAVPEGSDEDITTFINKEVAGLQDNYIPSSWEDMVAYAEDHYGEIIQFEGSPWEILKDKHELVGVPFMIADVRAYEGKFGSAVAIMLITEQPIANHSGPRYVINDGSTGIYEQVTGMIRRAKQKSGIMCPNGLRASDYTYELKDAFNPDEPAKQIPATTFYIA